MGRDGTPKRGSYVIKRRQTQTGAEMKKPAVFIDRDGTINEQMGYINHLSRFVLLPGVHEAVRLLNDKDFLAIVTSNQSGVARGYFPIDLVYEVNARMEELLKEQGAVIDGIYFCPHHPRGVVPEYSIECDCRKPKPGLIHQALESFEIDISGSYVIGDRHLDVEFADRANLKGLMVKTGYGLGDIAYILPHRPTKPVHIAEDLLDAVRWILERGND
jgi:D-glycero-D-manno-heptose 1,7-bisphosphate phosphatase